MTTGFQARTIQKQFGQSPVLLYVLQCLDQSLDLSTFTAGFLSNVWDISTARGFGLDIWGRILGQSRYLQIAQTPGNNFGFNLNPAGTVVNAINQLFAIGDGTTTTFQLTGPDHSPANSSVAVTSMYRRDWQGNQLLYATPRTNLALQSRNNGSATWSYSGASVTPGQRAPSGNTGAYALVEDVSNATHNALQIVSTGITAGAQYTYQQDIAPLGRTSAAIQISQGANIAAIGVNLLTGALLFQTLAGAWTGFSYSIVQLPNGYWRLAVTASVVGSTALAMRTYAMSGASETYQGNGSAAIAIDNAQLAAGVSASVIPTTTAPVTITDYTVTGAGVATMGQTPLANAVLSWNGTYNGSGPAQAWQPWSQAPFYGGAAAGTVAFALQDDYYRKLLLVKAAANIAHCDPLSINALMMSMFGDRGQCYCEFDPATPMSIGYHFGFAPTAVEQSIIQSGIFPVPAGMTPHYTFTPVADMFFGFREANRGTDTQFVAGWNQRPFYSNTNVIAGAMLDQSNNQFILDSGKLG